MNGFERRKEQKKENILRAALELFQTYGFNKVSINEIARKAGVSQVTIYNRFGSKEDLVREVVKTFFMTMLEKYSATLKGEEPFLEKLEAVVFDKTQIAQQFHGELWREVAKDDSELRQFINSLWRNEITQLLIDFFDDGRKQGIINPGISQEAVLLYFEIIRQGIYNSRAVIESIERNPKLVGELMSLLTYGLNG